MKPRSCSKVWHWRWRASARTAFAAAVDRLTQAVARNGAPEDRLASLREPQQRVAAYRESHRRYCWETASLADYRLTPFHLLAGEGHTFSDRDHAWHMTTLERLCVHGELLQPTA